MRTELSQALRAGRVREAARCAGRLARAGAMDDVVAATLYLHGAKDAPERVAADEWLDATARWGQPGGALRIAARDGLADASLWLELAFAAASDGALESARVLVEAALSAFPDDARLWVGAAALRLCAADDRGAAEACQRALALDPETPGAWLAAA